MIIYVPAGKAREYGELAANLYRGCTHGCEYCYAPAVLRMTKENFKKAPVVRHEVLEELQKEAKKYRGKEVFLSFTSDPYQDIDTNPTREAIKILHSAEVKVNILTKGGNRSLRDFDLLSANLNLSKYGTTLTFIDDAQSLKIEPGASLPSERINALKVAHALGIPTWASLEPVIDPEQSLELIRQTYQFVDMFKVGKWNHSQEAKEINWKQFGNDAIKLLISLGKKYYVKKDLANCLI